MSSSLGLFEGVRSAWFMVDAKPDGNQTAFLQSEEGESTLERLPQYKKYKQDLQSSVQKQAAKAHKNATIGAISGLAFLVIFGIPIIASGGLGAMIIGGVVSCMGGSSIIAAIDIVKLYKNLDKIALHPNRFCVIDGNDVKGDRKKILAALNSGLILITDKVQNML
jgi:hypothetical protein